MSFKFAQMTDTHLYAPSSDVSREVRDAFMRDAVRQCAEHNVDFMVNTGDLLTSSDPDDYHHFRDLVTNVCPERAIPYYFVRGNHDCMIDDAQYRAVFGKSTYWFEHKGWAFVGIDRYYKTYEHTHHAFCMSAEALDELKDIIKEIPEEMPLVAMLHDDPIGISRFHRGLEMLGLLQQRRLKLLLFGHVQASYNGGGEGIPFITVSGEDRPHDSSPLSYNIIRCDGEGNCVCDFHPYTMNLPVLPKQTSLKAGGKVKPDGDWLNLRGPNGNRSARVVLPDKIPTLGWKRQLCGPIGMGGLTIRNTTLFAGTLTKGRPEQCGIFALNAVNGEIKWHKQADGSVEGGVFVHEGRGFSGTTAGTVYCFNIKDGTTIWEWNNRDNMPIACQPLIDGDLLHCGANWEMYAINKHTGETVWRKIATANGFTYMGPGNSSPLVLNDRVYHQRTFNAAKDGGGLVQSVMKQTGEDLKSIEGDFLTHPLYRHASSVEWNGRIIAVGEGLMILAPGNFDEPWLCIPHQGDPGSATPAVVDNIAYISYHKEIVAYNLEDNGEILWRIPHEPALFHFSGNWVSKWGQGELPYGAFSAPLVSGDKLLVCDCGGNCRCLNTTDGKELWRIQVGAPILSAPIVSGNTLFLGDYQGRIYAFAW